MAIVPKFIYKFNIFPTKILADFFFGKNRQVDFNIYIEMLGHLIVTDFKMYYKMTVNKTVCYWGKDRHKDQWSGMELIFFTFMAKYLTDLSR